MGTKIRGYGQSITAEVSTTREGILISYDDPRVPTLGWTLAEARALRKALKKAIRQVEENYFV